MWFCPALKRPEALRRLADSWEKYEAGTPLVVRVWEDDPRREEYFAQKWPAGWEFYVSDTEHTAQALNEFFAKYPDEPVYGYISEDVVLTGQGGLAHLEALAEPFFIAYPNDTRHRNTLPTYCAIGGDLVRTLGWFAPPFLKQRHIEQVWNVLGRHCGLLRYAPQVVFYQDAARRETEVSTPDNVAFSGYVAGNAVKMDLALIQQTLQWVENQIRKEAGFDEAEFVHSRPEEQVVQARDVSGSVGGRERTGEVQELVGELGRVSGAGAAKNAQRPAGGGVIDTQARAGLSNGGLPFAIEAKDYKYKDISVLVGIPNTGEWKSGMAMSVTLMTADFMQSGLPGLRSRQLIFNSAESSMLVTNRHHAVKRALQENATHLLFIDSDMTFPAWALKKLLMHDLPFVAANCTKRTFPVTGTAFDFDGNVIDSSTRTGLEVVRQVGLAFALIRRDLLEALRPPLFMMEWIDGIKEYCGEDVFFAQKVQEAGFDVVIDHDLSKYIGHIGSFTFGYGQAGAAAPPHWRV